MICLHHLLSIEEVFLSIQDVINDCFSRQASVASDKLKDYLGLSHPDPLKAEDAARMVIEGRAKNLWPDLIGTTGTRVVATPVPVKQKCLYVDEEEEEPEEDSDDEDWYGEKAKATESKVEAGI